MTNDWKEMVRSFCLRTIRQFHFLLDLLDKQPNYVKKKNQQVDKQEPSSINSWKKLVLEREEIGRAIDGRNGWKEMDRSVCLSGHC